MNCSQGSKINFSDPTCLKSVAERQGWMEESLFQQSEALVAPGKT